MDSLNFFDEFVNIPLSALSKQSCELLSASLNNEKILTNEGHYRDWRGLSGILQLTSTDFNAIDQSTNKIEKLLNTWQKISTEANFSGLLRCLTVIGRFDVYDDIIAHLNEDARKIFEPSAPPEIPVFDVNPHSPPSERIRIEADPDNHIITKQDFKNNLPQLYDVFVMYCEDDCDQNLATIALIVEKLERDNFTLCIKERDFLFGISMEHDAVLDMITNRCYRVLIFVSMKLLESRYNKFLTQFCQKQSIIDGQRKIIPILLEKVDLPLSLKHCNAFCYYKRNPFVNFDDSLRNSLRRL